MAASRSMPINLKCARTMKGFHDWDRFRCLFRTLQRNNHSLMRCNHRYAKESSSINYNIKLRPHPIPQLTWFVWSTSCLGKKEQVSETLNSLESSRTPKVGWIAMKEMRVMYWWNMTRTWCHPCTSAWFPSTVENKNDFPQITLGLIHHSSITHIPTNCRLVVNRSWLESCVEENPEWMQGSWVVFRT